MDRERTTDAFGVLTTNKKGYWSPIPLNTAVFDVVNKDGTHVRVSTILDHPTKPGNYLGCLVKNFEERHTDLIEIDSQVLKDAAAEKRYLILADGPRFVQPA